MKSKKKQAILNVNIKINKIIKLNNKHNYLNFRSKEIYSKYLFYIIYMLVFSNLSNMNINKELFNIFKSYEIEMIIKGIGNKNILSNYYNKCPDKVYLNENLINISICHDINISSQEKN